MKKLSFVLIAMLFVFSLSTLKTISAGLPTEGDEETLEKSEIKNVTIITANLFNGLSYKDSRGDGGVFRDLTAIHPPYNASLNDVLKKKLPVDIKYENTRTYTGRFWRHENVITMSLTKKAATDAKSTKKKPSKKQ